MSKIDPTVTFETPAVGASAIVDFWNEVLAPKFIAYRHILEGGLSRHSDLVFPRLDVRRGDVVLDVGCGFGDTTLALAKFVGDNGHVTGVDCCPEFLQLAHEHHMASGLKNVAFDVADAEVTLARSAYDFVFARFGTMFFTNPVAGLRNLRRALRPGGRMTHIVWRDREENPWLARARAVLLEHLPTPDADAPSCGPGPFSMADPVPVQTQMEAAGFTDIRFEKIDAKVLVGRNVDEAIAFQLALGPAGEIYRTAGDEALKKHNRIVASLRDIFLTAPCDRDGIWMDSASWKINARTAS